MESHLLQMRGLKPGPACDRVTGGIVASFTDAWIETLWNLPTPKNTYVASFTDAWIETVGGSGIQPIPVSHLLQMRGLKPMEINLFQIHRKSHLLQMRGLKPGERK